MLAALSTAGSQTALRALHDELCPSRYLRPFGVADTAFFESRAERPPPPDLQWNLDDTPRLPAHLRLAEASARQQVMLVIEGDRVVAELPLEGDSSALAVLLTRLASSPPTTIGNLCAALDCEPADLQFLLDQVARRGWIVCL